MCLKALYNALSSSGVPLFDHTMIKSFLFVCLLGVDMGKFQPNYLEQVRVYQISANSCKGSIAKL